MEFGSTLVGDLLVVTLSTGIDSLCEAEHPVTPTSASMPTEPTAVNRMLALVIAESLPIHLCFMLGSGLLVGVNSTLLIELQTMP